MNIKVLLEILEGQGTGVMRAVHLVRPGNPWMLMGDEVLIYPDYYGEVIGRMHADAENLVVHLRPINVVSGDLHYREHVRWDPEVDCSYGDLVRRCLEAGWEKDWEAD